MTMKRRTFLQGAATGAVISVAVGAGLLTPRMVLAAWPKGAFEAKSAGDALKDLLGSDQTMTSDAITLKVPDIAENGAVVPVTISTTLSDVESISIVVEKNATPLTSSFILGKGTEGFISTRIKMGKTSNVIGVVKVKGEGKLYSAAKEVKVTLGGCGG